MHASYDLYFVDCHIVQWGAVRAAHVLLLLFHPHHNFSKGFLAWEDFSSCLRKTLPNSYHPDIKFLSKQRNNNSVS